jgi:hypothetical protein
VKPAAPSAAISTSQAEIVSTRRAAPRGCGSSI